MQSSTSPPPINPIEDLLKFIASFTCDYGELLVLLSTFFWSGHLILTDYSFKHFSLLASASITFLFQIMLIQYIVVTIGSIVMIVVIEETFIDFVILIQENISQFFWPLLLLSAVETIGMLLLAKGQNYAPPSHAAILLCLEGVFTTLGSFIFLPNETLHIYEWIGCVFILLGVIVATYYDEVENAHEE